MDLRDWRRVVGLSIVLASLAMVGARPSLAGSPRKVDPAKVVPLAQIDPRHREVVAEVIRDHTLHKQGAPDTFPCNAKLYRELLNEPVLTLGLWQDLSTHPATLRKVGPDRFEGNDGSGTVASWEYVYRSPKLHVMLSDLTYSSPRGNARLEGRIVLVVHSGYYKEVNGDPWVQHDIDAYVKIDSRGWKAAAVTLRPVIEKLLEEQVQEAGWFVSVMGRLVETYPQWADDVARKHTELPTEVSRQFRQLIAQNRRPNAQTGRPALADSGVGPVKR